MGGVGGGGGTNHYIEILMIKKTHQTVYNVRDWFFPRILKQNLWHTILCLCLHIQRRFIPKQIWSSMLADLNILSWKSSFEQFLMVVISEIQYIKKNQYIKISKYFILTTMRQELCCYDFRMVWVNLFFSPLLDRKTNKKLTRNNLPWRSHWTSPKNLFHILKYFGERVSLLKFMC